MTIKCVEDYAHVGLPLDVDAVLLNEVDGHPVVIAEEAAAVAEICRKHRCSFFQTAKDADEALKMPGATSLDAGEAAIVVLEDDPLFNAGRGAVFNREADTLPPATQYLP